jgi:hypothetical protein
MNGGNPGFLAKAAEPGGKLLPARRQFFAASGGRGGLKGDRNRRSTD